MQLYENNSNYGFMIGHFRQHTFDGMFNMLSGIKKGSRTRNVGGLQQPIAWPADVQVQIDRYDVKHQSENPIRAQIEETSTSQGEYNAECSVVRKMDSTSSHLTYTYLRVHFHGRPYSKEAR